MVVALPNISLAFGFFSRYFTIFIYLVLLIYQWKHIKLRTGANKTAQMGNKDHDFNLFLLFDKKILQKTCIKIKSNLYL